MKVFLAGATGRVATETLKSLVKKGHEVLAGARRPDDVIKLEGVSPLHLDLHADVSDLVEIIQGVDAVVFTAGSRGKDLLQTDAYGAVKLAQAAKEAGIKRFVMLSALYSLKPEKWSENLKDYYIAKFFADNYLVNQTELDYTIVQPGILVEEVGTGLISLEQSDTTSIPIPDVATVLAQVVDKPSTFKKVMEIHPGSTAIDQAF